MNCFDLKSEKKYLRILVILAILETTSTSLASSVGIDLFVLFCFVFLLFFAEF